MEPRDIIQGISTLKMAHSEGGKEYSSHNKTKEGQLDWAHIAQELPYKTHY
jgi:hypothetical protein